MERISSFDGAVFRRRKREDKAVGKKRGIKSLYSSGRQYYGTGDYSKAIAAFQKVIDLEENFKMAYTF